MSPFRRAIQTLAITVLWSSPGIGATEGNGWIDAAIPKDAVAVGRVQLESVLTSPLGGSLVTRLRDNYDALNWYLDSAFGFDLAQVDEVWFTVDAGDRGLALLQGRFDAALVAERLAKLPKGTALEFPGVRQASAFTTPEGDARMAAVLSENLLAVGDAGPMTAVLKSWQSARSAASAIRPAVQRVAASSADVAMALLDTRRFTLDPASEVPLIEAASLEGRLAEDVRIAIEVQAVDAEIGGGLEQVVVGALTVLAYHPEVQAAPMLLEAVRNATVSRKDATLTIKTQVPAAALAPAPE